MAYTKTVWRNRTGSNLNRYTKSNETATSVDLVNTPNLTDPGSQFSIEAMNHIETGIAEAHTRIDTLRDTLSNHSGMADGVGRNLMTTFGKANIAELMTALRSRCNGTGTPNFSDILIGDYIDLTMGLTIDGVSYPWNATYKNLRIVVSGFNTYKGAGDTENTKNHILFTFRNIVTKRRMNPANDNAGGYPASEMRAWLEGSNGNGTGDYPGGGVTTAAFLTGLKAAIGDYLYPIRKYHSIKGAGAWGTYTLWLPTEIEVFGYQTFGDETNQYNTDVQFPIFQQSTDYRIKRYNGSRSWWWKSTPHASSAAGFCGVSSHGGASYYSASSADGGAAPAFCVA
jgi:hypothetical protein